MKTTTFIIVFVLSITTIHAQSTVKEKSPHYKAAEELMLSMNMEESINENISQMVDMQTKGNPMLANKKEAFKTFMLKYMSWKAIGSEYLKMYMDEFTEAELKDMTAFYKTETGKKMAAKQNVITLKAAQLGQEKIEAQMPELMKLMQ